MKTKQPKIVHPQRMLFIPLIRSVRTLDPSMKGIIQSFSFDWLHPKITKRVCILGLN